jgi:hypothetical protein
MDMPIVWKHADAVADRLQAAVMPYVLWQTEETAAQIRAVLLHVLYESYPDWPTRLTALDTAPPKDWL